MSWSINKHGPAMEVATAVETDRATIYTQMGLQKANEVERELLSRACNMIVVACHDMKDKEVTVSAFGTHNSSGGHSFSVTFVEKPKEPPKVTKPVAPPPKVAAPVAVK